VSPSLPKCNENSNLQSQERTLQIKLSISNSSVPYFPENGMKKRESDFEANFWQKEHTQTQEHLVLRPCNISRGLSGETETLKQEPAIGRLMCDKQATGRTQVCRAPKFQPAVTVIISLPEKPSPSYTCMHRHARNTVTHPVSNNHNSHGSPRVLGMEAPDGRVRPPSGAAQRPQRRLHSRFPDAGDDDDETKSEDDAQNEAEGVEAPGRPGGAW